MRNRIINAKNQMQWLFSFFFSKGKFKKYKSVRDFQKWTKKMSKNRIGKGFYEKGVKK
jgi:hypothetical protein